MRALAASTTSTPTTSLRTRSCHRAFAVSSRITHRSSSSSSSHAVPRQHHHQQRHLAVLAAANANEQPASAAFDYEEPETAKEGIDLGLVLCKQGRWKDALGVFEKSINLPGTGVKRFRDKPRLISDGEKMALLYNIACCHSQMQDARSGLVALAGCLEAGYTEFNQVRSDPDLEFLRADARFEGLMVRFEKKPGAFMGFDLSALFGQK